jgi:hypothetical protein
MQVGKWRYQGGKVQMSEGINVGKLEGAKVLTFTQGVTLPSASPQAVSAPL